MTVIVSTGSLLAESGALMSKSQKRMSESELYFKIDYLTINCARSLYSAGYE